MNKLLTLKHWQLFGLIIGLPISFELLVVGIILFTSQPSNLLVVIPVVMVFVVSIFFGWFYALGTSLHKKLPLDVSMNLGFFKFCIFFPITYIIAISIFIGSFSMNYRITQNPIEGYIGLFILVHLFSMFCIFYCLYFIAKSLKTVEFQRPVSFGDYAGEFFLLWFFPVGIWIIQPRINKLFGDVNDEPYDGILDRKI